MAVNSPAPASRNVTSFVRGAPRLSSTAADKSKHDSNSSSVDVLLAYSPPENVQKNGLLQLTPPQTTISSSGNGQLIQTLKYSDAEVAKMRLDMEAEFEERLQAKEREWQLKAQAAEETRRREEQATSQLMNQMDEMSIVLAEYEKTIQQLSADKETLASQLAQIMRERDQALDDVSSVEASFTQLHQRYEKLKGTVDGFKQNEDTLKKSVLDLQAKLKKQEEKYMALKKHSEEKIQGANDEINRVQKQHQAEVARLEVSLKRAELRLQSQEQTIEQKTKQNQELEAICDELLSKVKSAR